MAFDPITVTDNAGVSRTYQKVGNGLYSAEHSTFDGPRNQIKISGGSYNASKKSYSCSVTKLKDINTTGDPENVVYQPFVVSVQFAVPKNTTTEQIDLALSQLSEFITPDIVNRMLMGEE